MNPQLRTGDAGGRTLPSTRRLAAITRAELVLLWRNRTATFTALALPLLTVGFIVVLGPPGYDEASLGSQLVTALVGFQLLFVVYYNLVSAYVARREELVLKRFRTSEATDLEVLLGTATPALAVLLVQIVLAVAAAALALELSAPVNALLVVVAVLGGSAVFVLLSLVSTAVTRNVEMAQLSTLPVLLICVFFSGLLTPLAVLPDTVETLARLVPLTPVVDLMRLGFNGTSGEAEAVGFGGTWAEAAGPVAVLVLWLLLGTYAARRWFRWEPRT